MSRSSKPIQDPPTPNVESGDGIASSGNLDNQVGIRSRHFVIEGMSHVKGSVEAPLIEHTIPELLSQTVNLHGTREAMVFPEKSIRWNWQKLADEVDRLAAGFLSLGLKTGDRVGIWSPNRPEWVLVQFATARLGLVLVTINPAYRAGELEHVLRASGCAALVMAPRFKSSNYVNMFLELVSGADGEAVTSLRIDSLPELKTVICMQDDSRDPITAGMLSFEEVASLAGPAEFAELDGVSTKLNPHDPINIQFTSGTTGLPKGATLSHHNILNNAQFTVMTMKFTENDRLCIPVPLYHCFGMVMSVLGCLTKGATMVFPGEAFDAKQTLESIASEKCTALYGVPTMFNAILGLTEFSEFNVSSLRTGIMAGAPCPIETMNRVFKDMNMREVTIAYGMTETSPVSFQSAVDDPIEKRVSTVGRVHPHAECRIIDKSGAVVPVGETGELCTRGYLIMKGYWGEKKLSDEAIDSEGWMHSGDLAVMDNEGFCNIVGRVKDVIIRGGENIYPREVEDYIYRFDKVKDVQVFGIPSENFGEEVCAWVVPKPGVAITSEEVREFCQGKIAHYKVPRFIRIRDDLPMTVSGKAQKFKMREEMLKELG